MKKEQGFTIVEVLVAALVLVAGSFATFGLLRAAALNTQRAKGSQVALDRAQQELEVLRSYTDKQLALTTAPEHFNNIASPNYRVSGREFAIATPLPCTMSVPNNATICPGATVAE